jgi:hypothetical protein
VDCKRNGITWPIELNGLNKVGEVADGLGVERCDDVTDLKPRFFGGGVGRDLTNHTRTILRITNYTNHGTVFMSDHHGERGKGHNHVDTGVSKNWRDERLTPFVDGSQEQSNYKCNASVRYTKAGLSAAAWLRPAARMLSASVSNNQACFGRSPVPPACLTFTPSWLSNRFDSFSKRPPQRPRRQK